MAVLAWCRAIMEAIVYPKRPSSRRDTSYPRAPAEYSDRCRKQRYLRHRCRKYLTYDTAARSPYTPRITPRLPRLRWHVVGQSLKLWCIPNGPVLDEIRRILVNPQNNQTGVVNKPKIGLIYDTAARSRHTPRIGQTLPRLFWHGVELSLKLPNMQTPQYSTRYLVSAYTRRLNRPVP